ncbi:MAG: radical SAM family heme chaperone HemW [Acutalibacteraceae bacterium]
MKNLSLYIHIPFCISKCPYCDFFSVKFSRSKADEYTDVLCNRIRSASAQHARILDTVYFGGGTPSIIGNDNLIKILDCISTSFNIENPEVTAEVNPNSSDKLNFALLKAYGLNRVSVGMQSIENNELKLLGRQHNQDDIKHTAEQILKGGIDNFSLDVMVGIPRQTSESLIHSLDFCKEAGAKHISAYLLKLEENTEFYKNKDLLNLPDDDAVSDLYLLMCEHIEKLGYAQYEISNFSLPGFESRHNLKYWRCEEYLGIGPAAHSFIDGKRYFTPNSFKDFYSGVIISDGDGGSEEEYIMLNLRLSRGVSFKDFNTRFGYGFPNKYIKKAEKFKSKGLLETDNNGIRLKKEGFLLSNYIIGSILY